MSELWMVNIRMRRIEPVTVHKRNQSEVAGVPKIYESPSRTWVLHDSMVHPKERAAEILVTELKRIHADRAAKQKKLLDEICLAEMGLKQAQSQALVDEGARTSK